MRPEELLKTVSVAGQLKKEQGIAGLKVTVKKALQIIVKNQRKTLVFCVR